jgi:hypothetical protein
MNTHDVQYEQTECCVEPKLLNELKQENFNNVLLQLQFIIRLTMIPSKTWDSTGTIKDIQHSIYT